MNKIINIMLKNDFIVPNYNNPNVVDLVRAIYSKYNIKTEINKNVETFKKIIPNNKHVLFILSDGTGSNLINKLSDNFILKKNRKEDIITVFPSTTACVLTSIVTAEFPEVHGIWGWFNYDRNLNINYCPLLFCDRKTEINLLNYGIKPKQVFLQHSLLNDLKTNVTRDVVLDFEEYDNMFYAYPSIDYGTASYYIKKGYEDAFEKLFNDKYDDDMILFKTEDLINNNFFGIGNFKSSAKDNLGEYISICQKERYLINDPNVEKYYGKIKGNHSGLSCDEMIIPLIIIDTNSES